MPKVTINGSEIVVPEGTTVLRAAEAAGVTVPYFCYHPGLSIPANCRMCLVEIEGGRKLEPSCYTNVRDGMVVHTESEKVRVARKAVLEFILVNHPIDCPICDQAGECWLQDHYLEYDAQPSRVTTEKVSKVKVYPIGPEVVFDGERCILCTRCIRFCEEITGTSELTVVDRSDTSEIRTFPGRKLDNAYSMCTADLCPVGALTPRSFRFKRRAWLLESTPSVCTGCARNCSVHLDHFQQAIERYVPRYNPEVNDYWMCDAGRLGARDLRKDRSTTLRVGDRELEHWPEAMTPLARLVSGSADGAERRWGLILSPQSTAEGLLAARHVAAELLDGARLYRGGKPPGDEDDLLIRADKNPNTAALDLVFKDAEVGPVTALIEAIQAGEINAVYMMGAHLPVSEEICQSFLDVLERLEVFVHQAIWRGPFAKRADAVLPAASHAEQRGTFINCDGVVQTVDQAYAPTGSSRPDWEIFLMLSRRLQKPLPFSTQADALEQLGVEAYEPPGDIPEADFRRAPHGPDRPIPQRSATPSALFNRYQEKVR